MNKPYDESLNFCRLFGHYCYFKKGDKAVRCSTCGELVENPFAKENRCNSIPTNERG